LTSRAKETARRGYQTALKTNDYWLGRLQTVKMYDRDPGEILTRNQRIDAITPQVRLVYDSVPPHLAAVAAGQRPAPAGA